MKYIHDFNPFPAIHVSCPLLSLLMNLAYIATCMDSVQTGHLGAGLKVFAFIIKIV